jgi:hypothetical protein
MIQFGYYKVDNIEKELEILTSDNSLCISLGKYTDVGSDSKLEYITNYLSETGREIHPLCLSHFWSGE